MAEHLHRHHALEGLQQLADLGHTVPAGVEHHHQRVGGGQAQGGRARGRAGVGIGADRRQVAPGLREREGRRRRAGRHGDGHAEQVGQQAGHVVERRVDHHDLARRHLGGGQHRQRERRHVGGEDARHHPAGHHRRVLFDVARAALAGQQRHRPAGAHRGLALAHAQAAVGVGGVGEVVGQRREVERVLAAARLQLQRRALGQQAGAAEAETVVAGATHQLRHLAHQQLVARAVADPHQAVGADVDLQVAADGAEVEHPGAGRWVGCAEVELAPAVAQAQQARLGGGRRRGCGGLEGRGKALRHLQRGALLAEVERRRQAGLIVRRRHHRQLGREQDARLERLDDGLAPARQRHAGAGRHGRLVARGQRAATPAGAVEGVGDGACEGAFTEARHSRPPSALRPGCRRPAPA